jgi:hypothetical protein
MPSAQQYTQSRSDKSRRRNTSCSACHWTVNLVTTEADRPALVPKNAPSAGTKSMLDSPCKYGSGSTSATFGERRHQRGRITLWNR